MNVYISEIERQCEFASYSAELIQQSLENKSNNFVWYYIQGFLIASANISKMLWSNEEQLPDRSKTLRESLQVSENSILKSRNMRNVFEHYDTRLDSWALNHSSAYISENISSPGMIFVQGAPSGSYFRNFDPSTYKLTFKNKEYDIPEILRAIENIKKNIATFR